MGRRVEWHSSLETKWGPLIGPGRSQGSDYQRRYGCHRGRGRANPPGDSRWVPSEFRFVTACVSSVWYMYKLQAFASQLGGTVRDDWQAWQPRECRGSLAFAIYLAFTVCAIQMRSSVASSSPCIDLKRTGHGSSCVFVFQPPCSQTDDQINSVILLQFDLTRSTFFLFLFRSNILESNKPVL